MEKKRTSTKDRGDPVKPHTTYISTPEAARITGMSIDWFQRARWEGGGPPYIKIARAVRYPSDELHAWLRARVRTSTTEAAA